LTNNEEVKTLYVFSHEMNFIPSGIDKVFPRLTGILISNCNLYHVEKANFMPFTELRGLWLCDNPRLVTLEKGVFDNNKNLEYLNLQNNNFRHIDANLIDGLNALTFIQVTCGGVELLGGKEVIAMFKASITKNSQDLSLLQKNSENVVRENHHKYLIGELQKVRKQMYDELLAFKQSTRLNKIRTYSLNKLIANFTAFANNIRSLKLKRV